MAIHQVLVTASPRDASTNCALEVRTLLRRSGESEIYARHIAEELAGDVLPLHEYRANAGSAVADALIFHVTIGEPEVFDFVLGRPERLVVVYHNISPATAFLPYDPAFAALLDSGRRDLPRLADRAVLSLTPSKYNAAELHALGFRNVHVWPLIVDVHRLRAIPEEPATVYHVEEVMKGPLYVFVGQLLPHKRPDLLLQAFHAHLTHLCPDAKLLLIGAARLPGYKHLLDRFILELNLEQSAHLVGSIPDPEMVAFLRRATAFVTASEHEGFCVPVAEAMALDVPVVARGYGAVPETVGDAGIVLPEGSGPLLLAEAMLELQEHDSLRSELVARGRRRLDAFDADRSRAQLLEHLLAVV